MRRERVATVIGIVAGIVCAAPVAWVTLMAAIDGADESGGGLGVLVTFGIGGMLTYGVYMVVALLVTVGLFKLLRVPD